MTEEVKKKTMTAGETCKFFATVFVVAFIAGFGLLLGATTALRTDRMADNIAFLLVNRAVDGQTSN